MKNRLIILTMISTLFLGSCEELLEPQPVALLIDNLALNEAKDVPSVRVGLYASFRSIASPKVLAGDFTADMLIHNGTFSQYREMSNKEITPSNATVAALWGNIYGTVYVANFILEKLPDLSGVEKSIREQVLAEAHLLRGYAYFVGITSFGKMPLVTTTDITINKNIARSGIEEVKKLILDDYNYALNYLPETSINAAFASKDAARAAFARFYLYSGQWDKAELYADAVIKGENYRLEDDFLKVVFTDFTSEAILEVGYSAADDPGTSSTGLNNLFLGRREIIPSNEAIFTLSSDESGDRFYCISFSFDNLNGTDNGWSVAKYGTADEDNNNIIVFRLAEMYLIRAEARVEQNNLIGAEEDINVLRTRAQAPAVTAISQAQMREVIEKERLYELAYEGHRWYDLIRTGRAPVIMPAFSANWKDYYNVWPVPQREMQINPGLVGDQNPGY